MMRRAALLLLTLPLAAQAAQWSKLPAPGGSTAFIDKNSIVKSGPAFKAWTMEAPATAQSTPDGRPYRAVKALQLYSCEDRTATLLMQVYYDDAQGKGAIVQTIRYEKFSADEIIPDSVADAALAIICKKPAS